MYYRGAQAAIVVYDITNAGERIIESKLYTNRGDREHNMFVYLSLKFKTHDRLRKSCWQ